MTDLSISVRLPLRFSDSSEPEPEVYVVKGKIRDFTDSHPKNAELIIEASESRLKFLRSQKASLYAKFGVRDYWIVNLKDASLEVCRRPIKDETAFCGFSYQAIQTYAEKDSVSPLAAPNAKIRVADLLP